MSKENLLNRILTDFQLNGVIYNDNYIRSGIRKLSARISDLRDLGYSFESYFTSSLKMDNRRNCCYIITNTKELKLTSQAKKNIIDIRLRVEKFKPNNLAITCKRVVSQI